MPSAELDNPGEPSGRADERTHKQSLILRKDLNMRKGKMVAQGAHASWAAVLGRSHRLPGGWLTPEDGSDPIRIEGGWLIPEDGDIGPWLDGRFAKICLGVGSNAQPGAQRCDELSVATEAELVALYEKAVAAGIPAALIRDAGLTEFNGVPTLTAVAVGPAHKDRIDPITHALKPL